MTRDGTAPDPGLIFDLGLHRGVDTAYYLAKGFRVVAVDASRELCEAATRRFAGEIAAGRLVVEHAAISLLPEAEFYESTNDQWGTTVPQWVARNERLGAHTTRTSRVRGVSVPQLMDAYGCPHYLKIDIEGADHDALASLVASPYRPDFVSLESDKTSWQALTWEIETLSAMGYTRFQAVPQHTVCRQRQPAVTREGLPVDHEFPWSGSSGLFGHDLPDRWLTARQVLLVYRTIFLRYRLFGDEAVVRSGPSGLLGRALFRLFGEAGWWDTHAVRRGLPPTSSASGTATSPDLPGEP
ncbi:FkbM family methyltransferase [Kutzneria sp. CA-103260]|uniref:FkbM family methyltransferase n=1 Tax=Kutzneria sp. CA-103260 TaxID=2802641 RepID=UPI001BA7ED94|nr:FkbM family methyltransferase [Kutzneria sp. CA-103260]QUQ65333.1 Methyltransferase FkbM domain protein [Kutzneria sp. CA-103260]